MRKRETAENDRDCAHARLVTRDGEIGITVSVTGSHVYIYIYNFRAGCTTRWARGIRATVLAPVYKRTHTGRDVKLAGPRATRKRRAGSLKVQRSP